MPVELTWDGKYVNGKKAAPVRIPLPFQDVETVNESVHQRNLMLDLWGAGRQSEWRNRLIWGDKKYVLPSLLPEFAGKVNLVYIDPPFATGADFSFTATVPPAPKTPLDPPVPGGTPKAPLDPLVYGGTPKAPLDPLVYGGTPKAPSPRAGRAGEGSEDDLNWDTTTTFTKQPSVIEQKAYRDTWGRGLDSYLQWFYETAVLLHELLAENGSLYVHLDPNLAPYAKVMLDEVMGAENAVSEIVWKRINAKGNVQRKWGAIHETILFYVKNVSSFTWNQVVRELNAQYIDDMYRFTEEGTGRRYRLYQLAKLRVHGGSGRDRGTR